MGYKCKYCNKESTHHVDSEDLCELHYLQKKPGNASLVIIGMRDHPPWKIIDRIASLKELRKHLSETKIENTLRWQSWYVRLRTKETLDETLSVYERKAKKFK